MFMRANLLTCMYVLCACSFLLIRAGSQWYGGGMGSAGSHHNRFYLEDSSQNLLVCGALNITYFLMNIILDRSGEAGNTLQVQREDSYKDNKQAKT